LLSLDPTKHENASVVVTLEDEWFPIRLPLSRNT
jgi:hypothetical protein